MACWVQPGFGCFWAKVVNDLGYQMPSRYLALDYGSASRLKIITSTSAFPMAKSRY